MNHALSIPRSTCRLFGAIKALGTIQRSAILVHGPRGCVYHINYIMGMRGDRPSRVYSTCLDEHDIIFGAEHTLVSAIEELDRTLSPELIAVLSCCASSIIGEDVGRAVRATHTRAKVIAIESGGFEGDFRDGYRETLKRLVEELAEEPDVIQPHSVNLIGLLRAGPDLRELKRILGMIGIHVNAVLTAGATIHDIARMGNAALNVVLCEPSGKTAAEALQNRFGTPFLIEDLPIGNEATHHFLEHIVQALEMPESLTADQELTSQSTPFLSRRCVAIIGGPTRAVAMTRYLKEHGVEPRVIVLDFDGETRERLQGFVSNQCEILVEPEQDEIIRVLKEKGIDLILGGMLERPLAALLGIEHLDIMHGSQKTMGFEGAWNLEQLLRKRD